MRDCRHKKGRVPSIVTLTATGSIRIVKGGTANLLTIREGPAIAGRITDLSTNERKRATLRNRRLVRCIVGNSDRPTAETKPGSTYPLPFNP